MLDYATRYSDAVPLKSISTEEVAEGLVSTYSRLGILSDLGTQFVSECLREISRLLSTKQLTTTPYHPMSYGLTQKFNGTSKRMLKKMCFEQPRTPESRLLRENIMLVLTFRVEFNSFDCVDFMR